MSLATEYLRNPRVTGNLIASSRILAGFLAKEVKGCKTIVEFGTGQGNITKAILSKMPKKATLYSFETNKTLCDAAKDRIYDKRLHLINDSAANTNKYVKKADCIISTLPLLSLPRKEVRKIIKAAKKLLKKKGKYLQIQYFWPISKKQLERNFSSVKVKAIWRNFPSPTFVYICTK